MTYKRRPITVTNFNIDDPDLLENFKKAAEAERARTLKSKKTARAALVRAGILTKSGRLPESPNVAETKRILQTAGPPFADRLHKPVPSRMLAIR